jgi:putative Ig domain-containing protein
VLRDQFRRWKGPIVFALFLAIVNAGCADFSSQPGKAFHSPSSASALKITTSTLPKGSAQSAYHASLVASGGTSPYIWKIQSGQVLPKGLSLESSTGTISGKPMASGQAGLIFTVTDSSQPVAKTATASLTIEIAATSNSNASLGVSSVALPDGQVSQTYETTVTATGGRAPFTWTTSSGSLPPGLSLNTAGTIGGTPTETGNYQFALNVVDSSAARQSATESTSITVSRSQFDQYGGLLSMPSPNAPTGMFRAEKFGNKWMLVDPDNNGLFMIGMYVLAGSGSLTDTSGYNGRAVAKYGDAGPHWATAQLQRIQSWGYNTVGPYSSNYALPFAMANTWSTPDHTNPVKFPFVSQIRPSLYGMINSNNWAAQPIKNMLYGLSKFYTGYRPSVGVADYYDSNFSTFFANQLAQDPLTAAIKTSPYKQYLIGMNVDDGDEMYGFGYGPDFRSSYSNSHLGWLVLTISPLQSANSSKGFVYSDTTVYSKKALRDQLAAEYGTIDALNSAWGSSYTTFDSSGRSISEAIGSGDGSLLSFSQTLSGTTVTAFSLHVLVAGQAVAGDRGDGTIWGPSLSGTINYATGAVSVTFRSGNAPASGAAIGVNYVSNGWGIGSGLMDEDGRPSHQSWTGIDTIALLDANVHLKSDLDAFLFQIADHYFSTCKTAIQNWMPGVMYFGPASLGTWGGPSNRNVLKAAAQDIDVMVMGGGSSGPLTQAMLDFVFSYYGDKPFYIGEFRAANPDSALFAYPFSGTFATQGARGKDYFNAVTSYANAAYSANGSRPYVGVFWWQYLDNSGERTNWGLVSPSDNAYDGHEAVTGSDGVGVHSIPCSAPLHLLKCGGEVRNYGDVITSVKSAHQQVMQGVQQ